MTKNTFLELWNTLTTALPTKIGDNPRLILMYRDEAGSVPDESADKLLKAILKEHDFFPKLSQFADICARFKIEKPASAVKNSTLCPYCRDVGYIYDELHDNRTLALICPKCDVGRSRKRSYFYYYDEKYGEEGLEELKRYNEKWVAELGDPKEYFFKMMEKWGEKMLG